MGSESCGCQKLCALRQGAGTYRYISLVGGGEGGEYKETYLPTKMIIVVLPTIEPL